MKKQKLSPRDLLQKLQEVTQRVNRYAIVLFIAFVAVLYAFLVLRVNNLTNIQPSPDAVNSQVKAAHIPRIDPAVVQQLQSLQDNSVSVQSLFNSARANPFQE